MPTSPAIAAIVLLLNGVQVDLPAPALLVHGVGCVPVRAVVERVGGTVSYAAGEGILVELGGHRASFAVVGPGAPPQTDQAVTLDGVVYVAGRDLAAALGGICRWQAALRALDLIVPAPGPSSNAIPTVASPRAALSQRGAYLRLSGRIADRSAALHSPTPLETALPPDHFWVDDGQAVIPCITQDEGRVTGVLRPFEQRGDQVDLHGRWQFDEAGAGRFGAWAGPGVQSEAPQCFQVSTHRRLYARGDEVLFLLRRVGSPPPPGCTLEVADGSGRREVLSVPEDAWLRGALSETRPPVWTGQLRFPLGLGRGREGLGLWSATLRDGQDEAPARCWFLVSPAPAGGVVAGGR